MKRILLLTKTILFSAALMAQETTGSLPGEQEEKPLKISGSADVYYKYDFSKSRANGYTSFTQTHDQFAIGMASVKLDYSIGNVGAVVDLGFGQRAKDFAYTDNGITQAIKQAYVYYSPVEDLKLSAGTWATHVGYELLDPQLNRNYSMSYMFTTGPFLHTGVKGEYTAGTSSFMLGVANPTDFRIVPDSVNNGKFLLAQYSFKPLDAFNLYLNYVGGKDIVDNKTRQIDAVITSKLSDKFSLGYNGTVGIIKPWDSQEDTYTDALNWWGSAVYLNYDPQSWVGLTWRAEYFSDRDHLKATPLAGTEAKSIFANTLSVSFKKGGFTFIPELRYDMTNKEALFVDKDGAPSKNDFNILLAAIYSF